MQNFSQTVRVVVFFSSLLLGVVVVLGIFNHVGAWGIISRIFLYVPIFAFLVFLIMFFWGLWGREGIFDDQGVHHISKKYQKKEEINTQASNLGRSLDIKEEGDTPLEASHVEPEKAAQVIRQMLAEDKD